MKNRGTRFGTTSRVAVAAAVMAVPILAHAEKPKPDAPSSGRLSDLKGQLSGLGDSRKGRSADAYLKEHYSARFEKLKCPCVIAGSDGKHEVYKNSAGKYFWLDPKTGDQKFVSENTLIKDSRRSK